MVSKTERKDADLARLLEKYPSEAFESLSAALNEAGDYRGASNAIKAKRAKKDLSGWLKPPKAKRRKVDKPVASSSKTKGEVITTESLRSVHEALRAPREPAIPVASTSKASILSLSTPALVAKHSPCTLVFDVLKVCSSPCITATADQCIQPDLAARIYLEMLEESSKCKSARLD